MADQEVDTENLHEMIHERTGHVQWAEKVALTTALLAVMAAVSNLMSTHEADRALERKIEASDRWAFYQAKSIKEVVTSDPQEKARYGHEEEQIRKEAEESTDESKHARHIHLFFAYAVTIFQVATAIGAIAVLVKKRMFWYTSIGLGVLGIALVVKAILLF